MGPDPEAVSWVNAALEAVFTQPLITEAVINNWLDSLSEHTKSSGGTEVRTITNYKNELEL